MRQAARQTVSSKIINPNEVAEEEDLEKGKISRKSREEINWEKTAGILKFWNSGVETRRKAH